MHYIPKYNNMYKTTKSKQNQTINNKTNNYKLTQTKTTYNTKSNKHIQINQVSKNNQTQKYQ